MRERCKSAPSELAAVVSLGRVGAKDVLLSLGDQFSRVLAKAVAARSGSFELDVAEPSKAQAVIPCDVAAVLHAAIGASWEVHEVLMQLGERSTWFPSPGDGWEPIAPLLEGLPIQEFRDLVDGSISAFDVTRKLAVENGHATLLMLDALGALTFQAEPKSEDEEAAPAEPVVDNGPLIEIQISDAASAENAEVANAASSASAEKRDARAEVLRDVILDLHGELGNLSYYALLSVESDATQAQVKRGYLKAAKRLHPDQVTHLGLDDVKEQANELFAQIARAYEVLSDIEQRESYDATQAGHTDIDANRVAQAELLFRKGYALLRAGNFRGALEFLEGAVQYWPEEADYQAALAWALHRATPPQSERALEHFERTMELGGEDNAQYLLRMSLVVKELGDPQRASQLAARAKSLDGAVSA